MKIPYKEVVIRNDAELDAIPHCYLFVGYKLTPFSRDVCYLYTSMYGRLGLKAIKLTDISPA